MVTGVSVFTVGLHVLFFDVVIVLCINCGVLGIGGSNGILIWVRLMLNCK